MTPEQIIALMQAAKANGVISLKFGDLEFSTLGAKAPMSSVDSSEIPNTSPPVVISPEEEQEIKHKVEELTSIMKLDDNELIDRMFPLPKEEDEGAA